MNSTNIFFENRNYHLRCIRDNTWSLMFQKTFGYNGKLPNPLVNELSPLLDRANRFSADEHSRRIEYCCKTILFNCYVAQSIEQILPDRHYDNTLNDQDLSYSLSLNDLGSRRKDTDTGNYQLLGEKAQCIVKYWRKMSKHEVSGRYGVLAGAKYLLAVIDQMIIEGYLKGQVGWHNTDTKDGEVSHIIPTDRLKEMFANDTVANEQLNTEIVWLRGSDKQLIDYIDNDDTIRKRNVICDYNELMATANICGPDNQRIPNEQFKAVAIYSKTLERNGRIYYPWQNTKREIRLKTTIENEAVIEMDFSAFHPRMLYELEKVKPPADPYGWYPPDEKLSQDEFRKRIAKPAMMMLINCTSRQGASRSLANYWGEQGETRGFEPGKALDGVASHNPRIKEYFYKDKGSYLMWIDSQIATEVISAFVRAKRPLVILHDSFIVARSDKDILERAMVGSYVDRFDNPPKIDTKIAE